MSIENFGHMPDGGPVQRITLEGGGLTAHVLTYGSVIQDLRLEGHEFPLVLGFPEFAPYLTDSPYFGATAGRCANRIRDGHLELDGETFQLDVNLGKHHIHGGSVSLGKRVLEIEDATDDSVTMSISFEDGEMGYPGNLDVRLTYALTAGGALNFRAEAKTDAPTLCNLAHHSYFNFDGAATIDGHRLKVAADAYLPTDAEAIPTGDVRAVADTPFDFRTAKDIGPVCDEIVLDHNYCLSDTRQPVRPVAWLSSPASGVSMEVRTTETGLQVYDGRKINVDPSGLTGVPMRARSGIAIEAQNWPDAIHHEHFPQAVLRPGETYRQHTQFVFTREES